MIKIKLAKPEANFVPAEQIAGKVTWSEAEGDSLEVRLIWYTVGKGDRDFGVVATHRVAEFGSSGGEKFEFFAPNRPQSFSGKLISLQWALEMIVFPSQAATRIDLTISNTGSESVLGTVSKSERS